MTKLWCRSCWHNILMWFIHNERMYLAALMNLIAAYVRKLMISAENHTHPYTISSVLNLSSWLVLISLATFSKSMREASTSSGSFSNLLNIFRKWGDPASSWHLSNGPPFLYFMITSISLCAYALLGFPITHMIWLCANTLQDKPLRKVRHYLSPAATVLMSSWGDWIYPAILCLLSSLCFCHAQVTPRDKLLLPTRNRLLTSARPSPILTLAR